MNPHSKQVAAAVLVVVASLAGIASAQQVFDPSGSWAPAPVQPQAQQPLSLAGQSQHQFSQVQAAQLQQQQQQLLARQPIAADLQNQVNALGVQLAAANRQLEYFQQQLSGAQQLQPQPQPAPQQLASVQPQFSPQQFQQSPAQPQLATPQPQQFAPQQFAGFAPQPQPQPQQPQPQQPQPQVSTLIDEVEQQDPSRFAPSSLGFAGQPSQSQQLAAAQQAQLQQQQQLQLQQQQQIQQQQQLQQQAQLQAQLQQQQQQQQLAAQQQQPLQQPQAQPAPTTVDPPQQPQLQAPPANQPSVHSSARNDDKFSIGLGVLSPGYTQKFGNTALDFNQDKNGFSFTLSNNGHNHQAPQPASKPAAESAPAAQK